MREGRHVLWYLGAKSFPQSQNGIFKRVSLDVSEIFSFNSRDLIKNFFNDLFRSQSVVATRNKVTFFLSLPVRKSWWIYIYMYSIYMLASKYGYHETTEFILECHISWSCVHSTGIFIHCSSIHHPCSVLFFNLFSSPCCHAMSVRLLNDNMDQEMPSAPPWTLWWVAKWMCCQCQRWTTPLIDRSTKGLWFMGCQCTIIEVNCSPLTW